AHPWPHALGGELQCCGLGHPIRCKTAPAAVPRGRETCRPSAAHGALRVLATGHPNWALSQRAGKDNLSSTREQQKAGQELERPVTGGTARNVRCNVLTPESLRTSTISAPLVVVNSFGGGVLPLRLAGGNWRQRCIRYRSHALSLSNQ